MTLVGALAAAAAAAGNQTATNLFFFKFIHKCLYFYYNDGMSDESFHRPFITW